MSRKFSSCPEPAHDSGEIRDTPASDCGALFITDLVNHDIPALANYAIGSLDDDDDDEIFSYEPDQYALLNEDSRENSESDSRGPAELYSPKSNVSDIIHLSSPSTNQCVWQPPDSILSNPQIQVDYFTQTICKAVSAFDSDCNSLRKLAISRVKESLLFFSLFRFITAAFLNSSTSKGNGNIIVRNAQVEILQRLRNEVAHLDHSKPTKIEDTLLAVIMFGLSVNWDGSNSPSIVHYNGAVRLYHYAYPSSAVPPEQGSRQDFALYALAYWWMGLGFITDVTEYCVLEPPLPEIGYHDNQARRDRRTPHPLVGVCPEAQILLGRVGRLVHNQRVRSRKNYFITVTTLQTDLEALQEAQRLEKAALSLTLPEKDNYMDISDPDTPMVDLFNIAEVYRLSALILLYRTFPDLLDSRFSLATECVSSGQSEVARLSWVTMLAAYALELLGQNSLRSGTRSIEQILLVIIAGELRQSLTSVDLSTSSATADPDFEGLRGAMFASPICTALSTDQYTRLRIFEEEVDCYQDMSKDFSDNNPAAEYISEARTTVLKRLRAIREILPYKSLDMVEELILKTWAQQGYEQGQVFWMDVMIENDWKFLLV